MRDGKSEIAERSEDARQRMVRTQLQPRGIKDPRVLRAMEEVPREQFVADDWRHAAYTDGALPIESGQTISQPFTVAFMCEAAQLSPEDKVLEIGTGSGYGAAVLSRLCREVHTVERIPELSQKAAERLSGGGCSNVHVHLANGTLGLPEEAPFDAIVVTAGAEAIPRAFLDQLGEGGRVVIPLGNSSHQQTMYRIKLQSAKVYIDNLGGFAFVPLIGEHGWHE